MNIPVWLGERLAGTAATEPPDGAASGIGEVREATPTANGLRLATAEATCDVRFLSDVIAEVRLSAGGDLQLPSFARLDVPQHPVPTATRWSESEAGWDLISPAVTAHIARSGLGVSLATAAGAPILAASGLPSVARTPRGWRATLQLESGDRVYGLGAKTGPLDRRGRRTVLWARDALVGESSDPLYSAIPFFLIARGERWIGVLLDSAARSVFDLGHSVADRLAFGPRSGALVYVVFSGPTLAEVMAQYTSLVGRMPLPPRWSLGHHQSRYSYNDAEEVREIAAEFRKRDIPTDAIHLDIHYMRGFRVFTFDAKRFPAPRKLADELERDGFRLVTIVDPGVKKDKRWEVYREGNERGLFARAGHKPFTMKVWPGDSLFPDFYRAEVRRWWGEQHRVYADAGIAGIWNDMNEPAGWNRAWYVGDGVIPFGEKDLGGATHRLDDGRDVPHESVRNAYGHCENRATYEALSSLRPNERPFVLTRSAFAGTQRWAAQWTGDVMSTWSALRQSLPMMMGIGLSGQPFVGSDIGGFFSDSNPELYARWIQIGALAPFCRSHTALYTHRQEPWSFGPKVEAIARAALKQRYQLLPYLYTCFWQSSQTGMPLWRPLCAELAGAGLEAVEDQVMIGPSLMAAPVVEQGATSRKVVLPLGDWFDWYNGAHLEGGRTVEVDAPLERMPLFVRGSAAIPTQPEVRHTGDRPDHPLIWEIFLAPGASGEIGCVYEDDGHSFEHRDGAWRLTRVRLEAGSLHFDPEGRYQSPRRRALLRLYGAEASGPLEIDHDVLQQSVPISLV